MTTTEKANKLVSSLNSVKLAFKSALEAKGLVVSDQKLKEYPELISQIVTDSGVDLNIVVSATEPENPVEDMIWVTPDDLAEYVVNTENATATAADIVYGKTAYVKGELLVGTHTENGSGDASFYKCISIDVTNKKWKGIKATLDNGTYVFTGEAETLDYITPPVVGSIYNSNGRVFIDQMNLQNGSIMYRRNKSSGGGGYNLDFVEQVDSSNYNTAPYFFHAVSNKRFVDYHVPSESYAVFIGWDKNVYSFGSYSWGDCISGRGGAVANPNLDVTSYVPRLADASGNWERMFCVYQNTWGLNSNKELYRCGRNEYGELGFGDTKAYWKLTKLEVDGITEWKKVAVYNNTGRAYILSEDGRLFASGDGQAYGELGIGDPLDPTKISWSGDYGSSPYPTVTLSADGNTLTVSGAGTVEVNGTYIKKTPPDSYKQLYYEKDDNANAYVYANTSNPPYWYIAMYKADWGYAPTYYSGQAALSTTSFMEIEVDGVTGWADVFSGNYNAGAITDDGRLFVWGRNNYGQLGQGEGNTDNQYKPVQIGADKTWLTADFGEVHLMAVATDGTLWGAGRTNYGQLGLGSSNTGDQYTLVQVGTKTNWKHVSCQGACSMIINNDTKVYYCGSGSAIYGGGSSATEYVPTYHGYKIGDYQRCDFERILTNDWNDSDVSLIRYCKSSSGTFTIPDGVSDISDKAFKDNGYGSYSTIYIPASVETIHESAFSGLYSTNIVFEAPQTEIPSGYPWGHGGGDSYFIYDTDFEHVVSNETLEYLISDTFPEDYALVIPEGVSSVYYKFQNYESITSVKIPDTITSLESAFSGCQNLHTVYIGDISNDSYFMSPFYNCPKLTKIYCDWYRGEKPNVESNAPWGASNATVIYKHPERLDIKLTAIEGDSVGDDGIDITTLEGEYYDTGIYSDGGYPLYTKSGLGASEWRLTPPGTIGPTFWHHWTLRTSASPTGSTDLIYIGKEDGSSPFWPLGECSWRANLGSDRTPTVVITITVLDNTEDSEAPEVSYIDDEPTLESVVL